MHVKSSPFDPVWPRFQSCGISFGHFSEFEDHLWSFFAISWDFDFEGLESRKIIHKSNFGTKIIENN